MSSTKLENCYTLPDLVDLSLRVPEIGAVNFNLLHTILQSMIFHLGLEEVRPWVRVPDSERAKEALAKSKRRSSATQSEESVTEIISDELIQSPSEEGEDQKDEKEDSSEDASFDESDSETAPKTEKSVQSSVEKEAEADEKRSVESETKAEEASSKEKKSQTDVFDKMVGLDKKSQSSTEKDVQVDVEEELEKTGQSRKPSEWDDISKKIKEQKKDLRQQKEEKPLDFSAAAGGSTKQAWMIQQLIARLEAAENGLAQLSSIVDWMAERIKSSDKRIKEEFEDVFEKILVLKADTGDDHRKLEEMQTMQQHMISEADIMKTVQDNLQTVQNDLVLKVETIEFDVETIKQTEEVSVEEFEDVKRKVMEMENKKAEMDKDHEIMQKLRQEMALNQETMQTVINQLKVMHDDIEKRKKAMDKRKTGAEELAEIEDRIVELEEASEVFQDDHKKLKKTENVQKIMKEEFKVIQSLGGDLKDMKDNLLQKADFEDVEAKLALKGDLSLVNSKVDQIYFETAVEELGEAIGLLGIKFQKKNDEWDDRAIDMWTGINRKMSRDIFDQSRAKTELRLTALLRAMEELKRVIDEMIYPTASCVTRCITCRRPAGISGHHCVKSVPNAKRLLSVSNKNGILENAENNNEVVDIYNVIKKQKIEGPPYELAQGVMISIPEQEVKKELDRNALEMRSEPDIDEEEVEESESDSSDDNTSIVVDLRLPPC